MILADTSVWIDHLGKGDAALKQLLSQGQVLTHPFVIGELALGSLRRREIVLDALGNLSRAEVAGEDEVLCLIDRRSLFAWGIGYVDAHLLASVALTRGALLWTRDPRLRAVAKRLGFDADLS